MTARYLAHDVYAEPLVNRWYAWPFLLAPQTLAMVIANHHVALLDSFVRLPALHERAVQNPKMRGGPFIDLPASAVAQVRALLEQTRREQAHMIEFAAAVAELDALLASEARGFSLIDLYPRIPARLRGYVELGYDRSNRATPRFVEALLYHSEYYDPRRQSLVFGRARSDRRPFVLSTPRWPEQDRVELRIPFADARLDRLFAMRERPLALREIEDLMPDDARERELFEGLFCEQPPAAPTPRAELGERVRIRYFGHAAVLIESKEVSVMIDPVVSYVIDDAEVPRFSFQDLPARIDYVLLSHSHQDHVLFETLLPLRHKIGTVVVPRSNGGTLQDPSLRLMLEACGFRSVVELDELQSLAVPGGAITGLPFFGEHGDLHIRSKLGFHLRLGGKTIVCAVDSNNIAPELYAHVRRLLGEVDCLFLGMECEGAPLSWLYGPLLTTPLQRGMDQSRRFDGSNAERGLEMVAALEPKQVYVYAMGLEPWLTFISSLQYTDESLPIVESNRLVDACREQGRVAERLFGRRELWVC